MNLRRTVIHTAVAIAATAAAGLAHATAAPIFVGLELSLVIDVSGSIDTSEYNLQRNGYKAAFQDAGVQSALLSYAPAGGVVVNVIQFSDNATQAIGWTRLTNATEINNFANALGSMGRLSNDGTDVQDGMALGVSSILNNGFTGARLVIDVSGDGVQNSDPSCDVSWPNYNQACTAVRAVRDNAAANGITINGLAIEGDFGASGVTNWYNANVRTSSGFVITATNFDDFERAAIAKIGREVGNAVPAPAALLLTGIGMLGVGISRRRKAQ